MAMEKKVISKKTTGVKTTSSVKRTTKKASKSKPTYEQIQQRAYQIYVESGYKGNEVENWLKAEKELK